jgi:hypothetical protein
MITFAVLSNDGRDMDLEARVSVTAEYAPDREYQARRDVRLALQKAAATFPPEWPRDLTDWCRVWWADSLGAVRVTMPVAMGRHVLALQEREVLQEAAS